MPVLKTSEPSRVEQFVSMIGGNANNGTVSAYASDAWLRRGFTRHLVQVIAAGGTVKVFGTLLPEANITVPFVAGEWVDLGDCAAGDYLELVGGWSAMRMVRDATTDPMRAILRSYGYENVR